MTRERSLARDYDYVRKSDGPQTKSIAGYAQKVCKSRWTQSAMISVLLFMLLTGNRAVAQITNNLEFSGGYTHITGSGGLDGLNVSTALWMDRRISIAFDYDSAWNNQTLGVFALTSVGHVAIKSHLQNFLIGPRVFFPIHKFHRFVPFGEVEIGGSNLSQQIAQVNLPSQSAAAHSFSWLLGTGGDYRFSPHWTGRVNLDFLRTHFVDQGQSRFRFGLVIAYTIGAKNAKF